MSTTRRRQRVRKDLRRVILMKRQQTGAIVRYRGTDYRNELFGNCAAIICGNQRRDLAVPLRGFEYALQSTT